MRNSTATRRQWVIKHVSGRAAVGRWMLRLKKWTHDQCPRCGVADEDTKHVVNCQDPRAKDVWTKSLAELAVWMKKEKTHPGIRAAIIGYLKAWQADGPPPNLVGQQFFDVPVAIANQNTIGWQAMMDGSLAQGWQSSQQRYYEYIRSKKTGLRWTSALIRKLWQIAWDMWEHRNGILHDKEFGQAAVE